MNVNKLYNKNSLDDNLQSHLPQPQINELISVQTISRTREHAQTYFINDVILLPSSKNISLRQGLVDVVQSVGGDTTI